MSETPDRAATILARFNAAQRALVGRLRELPVGVAETAPARDAWTPAQIGWHVALTHDLIAGVLLGSIPMAQPAPAGFKEAFDGSTIPARVKNPPPLEPPAVVGRDSALEKLRASGQQLTKAMASLTPERGAGYTVALPFGTLSLFELADFAAAHVTRHVAQVDRAVVRT
jgi:DinB family protein